jgi:hypothetical protein
MPINEEGWQRIVQRAGQDLGAVTVGIDEPAANPLLQLFRIDAAVITVPKWKLRVVRVIL